MAGILLIEDDASARHLLRSILERDSHTVWEAESPDEAWKQLEESATPEIAIVDLRLGESTGIDFIRRLRSDDIWSALPVVLCSASPDRESVLSSVQLGAAAFLTKPYDAQRIRAAVAKAHSTKWLRKHFEDPVAVTRRLSTDRDHIAELAKTFFAELQTAQKAIVETDAERKTALEHLATLRRSAAALGLLTIDAALAEWAQAGASHDAIPARLQRAPVLARLFFEHGL